MGSGTWGSGQESHSRVSVFKRSYIIGAVATHEDSEALISQTRYDSLFLLGSEPSKHFDVR